MKRDLEAAAKLEEKLRKADREAAALKEQQKKIEEEKVKMAAIAAKQKKQTEAEVGISKLYWNTVIIISPCCTLEEKGRSSTGCCRQDGQRGTGESKGSVPP